MFKKLFVAIAIFAVLVAGVGYLLYSNVDSIIKNAVEVYGAEATQTPVSLKSVRLSITSGSGSIRGLMVGSPQGFSAPHTLNLGAVLVKVDTKSIAGTGPIIIEKMIIDKPEINYEVLNSGATNLQTIAKNAQNYANNMTKKISDATGSSNNAATVADKKSQRKIIINVLEIRNAQMAISQPMLPAPLSANIPMIKLTNIGKDSGGATYAQVAQQVLGAITQSATQIASKDIIKQLGTNINLKGLSSGAGKDIGNQLKSLFNK